MGLSLSNAATYIGLAISKFVPLVSKYNCLARQTDSSMIFTSLSGTVSDTKINTSMGLVSHSDTGTGSCAGSTIGEGVAGAVGCGTGVLAETGSTVGKEVAGAVGCGTGVLVVTGSAVGEGVAVAVDCGTGVLVVTGSTVGEGVAVAVGAAESD